MSRTKTALEKKEKKVRTARRKYYEGDPVMSDLAFDRLIAEIRDEDPTSRVLKEVGAKPAGSTGNHSIPMGSLKEAQTIEEMGVWMRGDGRGAEGGFLVMAKVDGLSVALDYKAGMLVQALTRGNGRVGEDVTANVLRMQNVREEIPGLDGTLRGEAFLPVPTFKEKYADDYANPRNTAAGIVRRHSGAGAEDVALRYFYLKRTGRKDPQPMDRSGMLALIKGHFLLPVDSFRIVNIHQFRKKWESVVELRDTRYYEMDGVVVYVDRFDERDQGDPFLPDDALVWKFAPDVAVTTVTKIEHVAGRSGRVNPRVHVNPVKVGGVTVTHATGNNYPWLKNLGVGVDARVEVSRRGDTIPAIENVLEKGDLLNLPAKCPSCEGPLTKDGAYLKCKDVECGAKDSGKVAHWLKLIEVKGVGKKMLKDLVELGIKRPYQLYEQDPLEFWAINLGANGVKVWKQLEAKKVVRPELILAAHVSNVGRRRFRAILDDFGSIAKVLGARPYSLAQVDGIGEVVADTVVSGLEQEEGNIVALLHHVTTEAQMKAGNTLEGTALKFTGKMGMKRAELEAIGEEQGARIGWKPGFKNILVIADPNSRSAKAKAARKAGHELISEAEFMKRAGS